jgi:hypothetical protein
VITSFPGIWLRMGREMCTRCERPLFVCVCRALPPDGRIYLDTKVMVLQHPLENRKVWILSMVLFTETYELNTAFCTLYC